LTDDDKMKIYKDYKAMVENQKYGKDYADRVFGVILSPFWLQTVIKFGESKTPKTPATPEIKKDPLEQQTPIKSLDEFKKLKTEDRKDAILVLRQALLAETDKEKSKKGTDLIAELEHFDLEDELKKEEDKIQLLVIAKPVDKKKNDSK